MLQHTLFVSLQSASSKFLVRIDSLFNAGNVLEQLHSLDTLQPALVGKLIDALRRHLPTQIDHLKSYMLTNNAFTQFLGNRILLGNSCKPQLWTVISQREQPLALRMAALSVLQCFVKMWKIALGSTSMEQIEAEVPF